MVKVQERAESRLREAHLRDYWKIAWQGRWTIMAVFIVVVGATAVWTYLQTPTYQATAIIEVQPKPTQILGGADASGIGAAGYGYALHEGRHVKIPQLGRVVLEDDVEVGANSTIDRARFHETRVGRGTKLDNLVMLAHNVVTGEDCLLVSQVGVSGSTRLGDRVVLAGQVGTVGHVTVTDDVTVLGKGGITKDIREPGVYAGMPLKPARLWRRAMARLYAGLR